ncbi:MAG: NAD(P)H-dependent glycerol-3-phosphate dehydrogenase [Bacillota bacterium]|nr:NAD(P)H-dependent glycerol-3-phosphate dehydrogenase [Bacillota bacterium]
MNVAVLAMGSWGTALSKVLAENGHQVSAWARDPELIAALRRDHENKKYLPGVALPATIEFMTDRAKALRGAEVAVLAIPTQQLRRVYQDMVEAGEIDPSVILVNVSKGLEMQTGRTISQIVHEMTPHARFCCLSGPSHAEEVGKCFPTAVVAAAEDLEIAKTIQDLFSNSYFRVYTNDDVVGVEISGALKNIIALAAGIVDGLGFGDNAKAALITRGIHEITKLGLEMGARRETFAGLAGVGDLIVTCMSMHSRNRRAGILIGSGKTLDESVRSIGMVVEGAYTCKAVNDILSAYDVEMPITRELYRVLYEGRNAADALAELMRRDKKHETDCAPKA